MLPDRALTNIDLQKFAKKLHIPSFRGVFMRDTLPKMMWKSKEERAIVNLDVSGGSGTHWVAYFKPKGWDSIHYFDSFGDLQPPEELRKYFGNARVLYNTRRYQDFDSYLCGHLCLVFLLATI